MPASADVVGGFSPRFHDATLAAPRAKARDYIHRLRVSGFV
jgi:hypothetical protein